MQTLQDYREQIDKIDNEIVALLGRRFALVKQIGKQKEVENKTIHDGAREEHILARLEKIGETHHVSHTLIKNIWRSIFADAKHLQEKNT